MVLIIIEYIDSISLEGWLPDLLQLDLPQKRTVVIKKKQKKKNKNKKKLDDENINFPVESWCCMFVLVPDVTPQNMAILSDSAKNAEVD